MLSRGSVKILAAVLAAAIVALFVLDRLDVVELIPSALDDRLPGGDEVFVDLALDEGENAAGGFLGGPTELVYRSGTSLVRTPVQSSDPELLAELPPNTTLVQAAPGERWITYVVSQTLEGVSGPRIRMLDTETGSDEVLDIGVAPLWHPTGRGLAYLRPADISGCINVDCPGDAEVVVADPSTKENRVVLGQGRYRLLTWAGESLLVARGRGPLGETLSVSLDGEVEALDIPAAEVASASPDGRWLLTLGDGAGFVPLSEGRPDGDPIEIDVGGRTLIGAAWSPDSARLAAVLIEEGAETAFTQLEDFASELVIVSPDDPEPVPVEEKGTGATPEVYWAPDGTSLVLASVVDATSSVIQAFHCPIGTEGFCRLLLTLDPRVALLRVE